MFKNTPVRYETEFYNQPLTIETGLLARQATSTVTVTLGETTVMAAVVVGKKSDRDYFPLQVIYEEKMYASGKIKGSRFIKREGRPTDQAVLTGRMIDRSLRSLFHSQIRNEIQIVVTVFSLDEVNSPDIVGVIAASSALSLIDFKTDTTTLNKMVDPKLFKGPISCVRIGQNIESLRDYLVKAAHVELENLINIEAATDFLTQASEVLNINDTADKQAIAEIARILGNQNPEWAKEFSKIYKNTQRLNNIQSRFKYPTRSEFVVNPSYSELEKSLLDIVVSGDGHSVMMLEAGAEVVTEEVIGQALDLANSALADLHEKQAEFINLARSKGFTNEVELSLNLPDHKYRDYWNQFKTSIEAILYSSKIKSKKNEELQNYLDFHKSNLNLVIDTRDKEGYTASKTLRDYLVVKADNLKKDNPFFELTIAQNLVDLAEADLNQLHGGTWGELSKGWDSYIKILTKEKILYEEARIDGRKMDEVRPLDIQVDVLPRVHGASLFCRGETQVLNILTLGTLRDAQTLDSMEDFEETTKRYIHHYNFPPYSVGENGRYGPPSRREIGHGALAEKALEPVLPDQDQFPYTMRLVSECLGSNGSTSMASTCASTLSLMAGGVPIKDMVAGVAMGLVMDTNNGRFKVLTDIQGFEDFNGDMDFKVTGTRDGITAIQLDNKVAGLTIDILKQAIIEAKTGRIFILDKMQEVIREPKSSLAKTAPRVMSLHIPVDKIGEVIGPSGKNIKNIIAKFNVEVDIEEDGSTFIYAKDIEDANKAHQFISNMVREYQPGDEMEGVVYRIEKFGAFVKLIDSEGQELGKEGMIHISNLAEGRVEKVEDVVNLNQRLKVKVLEVNEKGQIGLSLVSVVG